MKPKYLAVILVKYPKADVAEIFHVSTDFDNNYVQIKIPEGKGEI